MGYITNDIATKILQSGELINESIDSGKDSGSTILNGDVGYYHKSKKKRRIFLECNDKKTKAFDLDDITRRNIIDIPLDEMSEKEFEKEVFVLETCFGWDVNLPNIRKDYIVTNNLM